MTKEKGKRLPIPLRALAWITGALSLLNLLDDLTPVKFYGALRQWISAYGEFVDSVGQSLFGWIDWYWIGVDRTEYHILVISSVLAAAASRASARTELDNGQASSALEYLIWLAIGILPPLALCLMLPSTFALVCSGLWIAFLASLALPSTSAYPEPFNDRYYLEEILSIAAIVILAVVANYMLHAVGVIGR